MQVYHWESSGKGQQKKSIKKTGTVILHNDEHVDLSFERLQKDHIHPRKHLSGRDDENDAVEDATAANLHKGIKAPMMTPSTALALQKNMGFAALLPSQAQCYRGIFKGRDVILHSRTGSGKTLAYALPIIERHLILEEKATSTAAAGDAAASASVPTSGPFLLIFVFSNELAFQTKTVLQNVYKNLTIGVAGHDDVIAKPCHVLVGTVVTLDQVIRGKAAATERASKRGREETKDVGKDDEEEQSDDDDDDDDDDDEKSNERRVDVSSVRAIVVDEVDTTLGPRFSSAGRRMKNLLKFVRRANGSLSEGLMSDFRAHHYVLCGATIPNWVIKAGFLGVKKFYYQLVTIGTQKLPPQLECYAEKCNASKRIDRAVEILQALKSRVVVFGTNKQLDSLEERLAAVAAATAAPAAKAKEAPAGKKKKDAAAAATGQSKPFSIVVRNLSTKKHNEMERVRCIEDFNSKTANVLLCTDIASRGLDFTDVDEVLMLSLPSHQMATEVFVHRAGRTARVGKHGVCRVLFDSPVDDIALDAISKTAHVSFKQSAAVVSSSSSPATGASKAVIKLQLTIRNPFSAAGSSASNMITASDVLSKSLGPADDASAPQHLISHVVEGSTPQVVTFEVPLESAHIIKKKLWKYDLKEIA